MEAFEAHHDHSIQTTRVIITTQTFKDLAETLMGTEPLIKEETPNTAP